MNEQRIEELKNALRDVMALIVDWDQPLTDELKTMLAQVMEHVANRIQQLRQEEAEGLPTIPEQEPELKSGGPSSNIESFGYDEDNGRLLVRFLGDYPNREGPVYAYGGVPKQIFDLFQKGAIPARTDGKNKWGKWWKGKVPSAGASLYTLIKNGGYSYTRLS